LDDRIIFVNKAFCKTYRYQEQEVLGKDSGILWMTKLQNGNTRSVFRMQTADGNWHIGFYHKRKDDSIFPVSMSRSIVKNAAGIQVAIVGTVQDIAERLVVEQDLRKANVKLKEQCQQKSSLAIAVAQTLERLLADSNIKSSRPCDNFPCSSLDAAKQVVRDFLCISQLAAGQYDLDLADTNLTQIITIALQPLLPLVRANNVDLIASEMNQHLTVRADCPKLAYALTNIVSTAMLFAPPHGSIEIKTNTSGDEVIVSVQINPAHAGNHPRTYKITNPEESLEQLPWRSQDDYPLALTAARQLIEMHDGRLWTENGQQKTNIYFALPLAPAHTMADTTPAAISSRS
jgi:PAS domain S-box-containing protein